MQVEDVVRIVDEASEVLQFNRALLQGAIENITQGISVVDQSLRLVAWNRRYIDHVQITVAEQLGVGHRGGEVKPCAGRGESGLHGAKCWVGVNVC